MEKIREAFKAYFDGFDIELPQTIQSQGVITEKGWSITYVMTRDEEGDTALDFLADHRMTTMRHVRIRQSGEILELETYWENYQFDPEIEGDKERAENEYQEHNLRVADLLHEKGLI